MPNPALRIACFLLSATLGSGFAFAAQRTFVASNGSDLNACSIAQPCRTFGRAITQTNAGGEVVVLDSAGYGPVTITQPVAIIAPSGVYAGISVFSGDGVTVNAPGGVVVLRGLTINGQGGDNGINIVAAQEVHVESTIVANMGLSGIFINTAASLLIKDSSFRDNGGSGIALYAGSTTISNVHSERNGGHGLYIQTGFASVDASSFSGNSNMGVRADLGARLTVHGTMISGNGFDGVFNIQGQVDLEDCSIDQNGAHGVEAHGDAFINALTTISRSHINHNGRTSAGSGIFPNNNYGGFLVTGTTLEYNSFRDVDATNCCIYTYQNNSALIVSGPNIAPTLTF